MLKKIYICLDNYTSDEINEIKEYDYLKEKDSINFFNNFYSMDNNYENNSKIMENTTSLEYLMFINYLLKNGYNLSKIEGLFNPSLFIFNDKLFNIIDNKIKELDINNVGFYSLRGSDWQHPFFFILKTLIEKKGGHSLKTNDMGMKIISRCKFYSLNSLYKKRKELIGNIIFQYNIKEEDYGIYKDFIKINLGDNILIKKDFHSCGEGNYPIDLLNFDLNQEDKFKEVLKNNDNKSEASYIVKIEKFIEEYRVYFTKTSNKIKIHSIKKKNIDINIKEIVNMHVFKYGSYSNWGYISSQEYEKEYIDVYNKSINYLENLDYNNGILEFGKTIDGDFVFFEVNTMGAVLAYKGEDTLNLTEYYYDLFRGFYV